jgi:hypothetical protein
MSPTRREFLQATAGTLSGLAVTPLIADAITSNPVLEIEEGKGGLVFSSVLLILDDLRNEVIDNTTPECHWIIKSLSGGICFSAYQSIGSFSAIHPDIINVSISIDILKQFEKEGGWGDPATRNDKVKKWVDEDVLNYMKKFPNYFCSYSPLTVPLVRPRLDMQCRALVCCKNKQVLGDILKRFSDPMTASEHPMVCAVDPIIELREFPKNLTT